MSAKKSAVFDFETKLKDLESIIDAMEKGGLTLDESLKKFEQGVALTRECQKALQTAEQKVNILTNNKLDPYETTD